jgi:O-acetyl-ADP-ribose deacetylase (regulator of RNase III)
VIHTVGPVWHGGAQGEDQVLANAYTNSLAIASENGLKSIAFPAISTGVYGYPKKRAAVVAFKAIRQFLSEHHFPQTVRLVLFGESDTDTFIQALQEEDLR